MKIIKVIAGILFFLLLTLMTQIGGIVYLLSLIGFRFINNRVNGLVVRALSKTLCFVVLYLLTVLVIVPVLAKPFGRVPLPIYSTDNLRPATIWTCLLNRNYVRPELRTASFNVADQMSRQYPGTIIHYLDANFPFINKFPLLPHLSHNDGRKRDISFLYWDNTGEETNGVPSFIGYGICEAPKAGEEDKPAYCEKQGYWQYSLLPKIVSQKNKLVFQFDEGRTRSMVNCFASQPSISRIFIEPHLKQRLKLFSSKIKFHGCQAVRHDDHLHVQVM